MLVLPVGRIELAVDFESRGSATQYRVLSGLPTFGCVMFQEVGNDQKFAMVAQNDPWINLARHKIERLGCKVGQIGAYALYDVIELSPEGLRWAESPRDNGKPYAALCSTEPDSIYPAFAQMLKRTFHSLEEIADCIGEAVRTRENFEHSLSLSNMCDRDRGCLG